MAVGRGSGSGVALVSVPVAGGASFQVLDRSGRLFAGSLPYEPHHLAVARRSDGVVVAGLADLRLNSGVFRGRHTPEPLRIYADGRIIYEVDKAWDFGIAADGSSFFVHEPLDGGASRLVIHDLDLGKVKDYDLGTRFTPVSDYESDFAPIYSKDFNEVIFTPAYADAFGRDVHSFYPVGDGDIREATGEYSNSALFASSEVGFFVDMVDIEDEKSSAIRQSWRISRQRISHGEDAGMEVVWSRDGALRWFFGTMILSDNVDWLVLRAWNLTVLDAATGEVVFEYSLAGDKEEELRRIANVVDADATALQVGGVSGVSFRDNHLLLYRQAESVVDVFDMTTIRLDGQPDFRVHVDPSIRCGGGYLLRGLQVTDGELRYVHLGAGSR